MTLDEIAETQSGEERLWTAVLKQAKEDLQEGHRMANYDPERPPNSVRAAWRVIRAISLHASARSFFCDKDGMKRTGAEAVCTIIGCDPEVFADALGSEHFDLPRSAGRILSECFTYLDDSQPGWINKRHGMSDIQLETLERLRDHFPVLAKLRGI